MVVVNAAEHLTCEVPRRILRWQSQLSERLLNRECCGGVCRLLNLQTFRSRAGHFDLFPGRERRERRVRDHVDLNDSLERRLFNSSEGAYHEICLFFRAWRYPIGKLLVLPQTSTVSILGRGLTRKAKMK